MHYYQLTSLVFSDLFSYYIMPFFFCPRSHSEWDYIKLPHYIELSCNWYFSCLWQFLILFFMTMKVLNNIGQLFCGMSLSGSFVMFFSWLARGYVFSGGRWQRQNPIFTVSYQGYILPIRCTTGDINLDHLTEVLCVRFLQWKATLPHTPFCSIFSGKKSLCVTHT